MSASEGYAGWLRTLRSFCRTFSQLEIYELAALKQRRFLTLSSLAEWLTARGQPA